MGEILAVLSGKGGTGKTSLCAALATALADMGHRVLCIDCDVGLRNLDIALGMHSGGYLSFEDVSRGDYPLESAGVSPHFPNLSFLTAPVGCTSDQVDSDAFHALLRDAREQFRYILLDAPAGVEQGFLLAARYADRVLLVTNPDPAALRDAAQTGNVLESIGKQDVRLVVNRVSKGLFRKLELTVDDIMDSTALPLIGIVPEDPNMILAAADGYPLLRYTRRGAARAAVRIAKRITGLPVPISLR